MGFDDVGTEWLRLNRLKLERIREGSRGKREKVGEKKKKKKRRRSLRKDGWIGRGKTRVMDWWRRWKYGLGLGGKRLNGN